MKFESAPWKHIPPLKQTPWIRKAKFFLTSRGFQNALRGVFYAGLVYCGYWAGTWLREANTGAVLDGCEAQAICRIEQDVVTGIWKTKVYCVNGETK